MGFAGAQTPASLCPGKQIGFFFEENDAAVVSRFSTLRPDLDRPEILNLRPPAPEDESVLPHDQRQQKKEKKLCYSETARFFSRESALVRPVF